MRFTDKLQQKKFFKQESAIASITTGEFIKNFPVNLY